MNVIEQFGQPYTRGMLQRAGRAGLYYWMRDNADAYGWQLPEFRLLSFRQKLNRGINDMTTWFSKSEFLFIPGEFFAGENDHPLLE